MHVGSFIDLEEDLKFWVNDGLMALFFLVVGLEIKRELVTGELRQLRAAILPVLAAIGGMVVPALLYLAIAGGDNARGWGIPMATDIAFALGALTLASRFAPPSLKPLLLTLAIVDDIGAILVIALFYSGGIEWVPLRGGGGRRRAGAPGGPRARASAGLLRRAGRRDLVRHVRSGHPSHDRRRGAGAAGAGHPASSGRRR